MFSRGTETIDVTDLLKETTEGAILNRYFGINKVPCTISSPLREDNNPSFRFFSPDGQSIRYIDFTTGEKGDLFSLLGTLWKCNFQKVISKIHSDLHPSGSIAISKSVPRNTSIHRISETENDLQVKVRDWEEHDIQYWESYGVSLEWLKFGDVYPVSHKIITTPDNTYVIPVDKYAYAFVERKEGKVTIKVYQPFNPKYKWHSKHDHSVISLWSKIPKKGKAICICSSVKDALCLWSNLGIPSIALQGEAYGISNTALNQLKERFDKVYILFDNDPPGIKDSKKLAEVTGFTNVILPPFEGGKDISDLYKSLGNKTLFKQQLITLFKTQQDG